MANEATAFGYGGIVAAARAAGMAPSVIGRGIAEVRAIETGTAPKLAPTRSRRPGGGRKKTTAKDLTLLPDLKALVESTTRGDPESLLLWTARSLRNIVVALEKPGASRAREGRVAAKSGDGVIARGQQLNREALRRGLATTLRAAQQFGRKVTVIGPVPQAKRNVPDAVARALWLGSSEDVRPTLADFQQQQRDVLPLLHELQREYGFVLALPHEVLCRGAYCDIVRDDKVLYTDDHHLSAQGVALLREMLARSLE